MDGAPRVHGYLAGVGGVNVAPSGQIVGLRARALAGNAAAAILLGEVNMQTIAIRGRERGLRPRAAVLGPCRLPGLRRADHAAPHPGRAGPRHRRRGAALVHGHHRRAAALSSLRIRSTSRRWKPAPPPPRPAPRARRQGKRDTQVMVLAGDGGTYDIGLQCLSSAAERNENILYFCLDNEGLHEYRGAEVPSTLHFARTGSHAGGQDHAQEEPHRDRPRTACPTWPRRASATSTTCGARSPRPKAMRGLRLITLLIPCLDGWGLAI